METQIVWESREEDMMIPDKEAHVFCSPQRDPNVPPRYLYNKDLFYLKRENTKTKKYVLSLYKIHATPFENDLEDHLKRWVLKEFKTFNKEARLSVQHWKHTWHKIVYINKYKKERPDIKEVYSYHKIVEVEVDIIKKTENQAKMTKLSMEWKRLCKIKAKDQKSQSQSQSRRINSQTGAGAEEYYWMQS
ncbi:hypothetical protein Tco_1576610 [Tanacetum coccineum]